MSSSPDGYIDFAHPSNYLNLIGPLLQAADDPARVALHIDERHTNSRGYLHAGVLVAIADVVMGHAAHAAAPKAGGLVTVSIDSEFPGFARRGDWIHGVATVRRAGRRLAFVGAEFTVDERLVLAASGIFAVTGGAS